MHDYYNTYFRPCFIAFVQFGFLFKLVWTPLYIIALHIEVCEGKGVGHNSELLKSAYYYFLKKSYLVNITRHQERKVVFSQALMVIYTDYVFPPLEYPLSILQDT